MPLGSLLCSSLPMSTNSSWSSTLSMPVPTLLVLNSPTTSPSGVTTTTILNEAMHATQVHIRRQRSNIDSYAATLCIGRSSIPPHPQHRRWKGEKRQTSRTLCSTSERLVEAARSTMTQKKKHEWRRQRRTFRDSSTTLEGGALP